MKIPVYFSMAVSGLSIILGSTLFLQVEVQSQEREFLQKELQYVTTNRTFGTHLPLGIGWQSLTTDLIVLSKTDEDAKRIVAKYKLQEQGQTPAPMPIPRRFPDV